MWLQIIDPRSAVEGWVWSYRARRGERRTMHRHPEVEFNLVTAGRASYMLPDRRIDIDAGTLIWLYPTQAHLLINESAGFSMWIAVFRAEALQRWCAPAATAAWLEGGAARQARRLDVAQARRLGALCDEALGESAEPDYLNATLRYLLVHAWRATKAASETPALAELHPAVEAATAMLQRETDSLSVPELAEASGLSASRLSRLFKQQVGLSISDYRNRLRVDRFCQLYGRGERRTMLDAALRAGFGSYPQFHRAFKRHMGLSPAAHRRRMRQKDEPYGSDTTFGDPSAASRDGG